MHIRNASDDMNDDLNDRDDALDDLLGEDDFESEHVGAPSGQDLLRRVRIVAGRYLNGSTTDTLDSAVQRIGELSHGVEPSTAAASVRSALLMEADSQSTSITELEPLLIRLNAAGLVAPFDPDLPHDAEDMSTLTRLVRESSGIRKRDLIEASIAESKASMTRVLDVLLPPEHAKHPRVMRIAADRLCVPLLQHAIAAGGDPNGHDQSMWENPLALCVVLSASKTMTAERDAVAMIEALHAAGVRLDSPSRYGLTAEAYAEMTQQAGVARTLLTIRDARVFQQAEVKNVAPSSRAGSVMGF